VQQNPKIPPASDDNDDLRPEYDLTQLKDGVRGKYYRGSIASPPIFQPIPAVDYSTLDGTAPEYTK
jgi:hypothetical protein